MAARSSLRVGGTGLRVQVEMDGVEKTADHFKRVRRDIGKDLRSAVVEAGEEVALPHAKMGAGNLKVAGRGVAGTLVVRKGTGNTAYLTSSMRGKFARAVGLQEFGGTVHTHLLPRRVRLGLSSGPEALTVNGHPVANVTTPRHYRGRQFMGRAVGGRQDQIAEAIMRHVLRTFDPVEHRP